LNRELPHAQGAVGALRRDGLVGMRIQPMSPADTIRYSLARPKAHKAVAEFSDVSPRLVSN